MKKGLSVLAIAMLIIAYLISQKVQVASDDETEIQRISEIQPVSDNVRDLRDAFTKTWKGSKIAIAKQNLEESPGQITTSKPKSVTVKKENKKKKKRKVAKKKNRKGFEVQIVNNDRHRQSHDAPLFPRNEVAPPVAFIPPKDNKTNVPQTVEEWMDRLINPINKENLDNLILSLQAGLITNELFYAVVDELLEYDDEDVQNLGVIALGSTPSPQSFDRAVKFIAEDGDTKPASNARNIILNYKKLEFIQVLNNQLYSVDSTVQLQAAVLIRDSALDVIRSRPQDPGNNPQPSPSPSPVAPRTISSRDLRVYMQSMTSMQSLLTSGQTQHQAVFQETIRVLEQLLRT